MMIIERKNHSMMKAIIYDLLNFSVTYPIEIKKSTQNVDFGSNLSMLSACLKIIPTAVGCGFRWLRQ